MGPPTWLNNVVDVVFVIGPAAIALALGGIAAGIFALVAAAVMVVVVRRYMGHLR